MESDQPARAASTAGEQGPTPLVILTWFAGGIFAIALLWLLRAAYSVFLPLAIGFFLAVAVLPVKNWIVRRVPKNFRWLGYLAAAGIMIGFVALFVTGIWIAALQVAGQAGTIVPQLQQRLAETPLADLVSRSLPQGVQQFQGLLRTVLESFTGLLGTLVIVFFLMLLMLLESRDWKEKTRSLRPDDSGRDWRSIAEAVGQKFRRYFVTRLALGTITGALYAAWLALFGVPLLLVWGLLALLLNFIPTIGSLIAGALPVLFVFAQQDLTTAIIVGAGILVIEQIMGNYIDPRITGSQLALSPLVVLLSLLLWTWVWGIAGALISTPMTMLVAIVLAHIHATRPIALMLSEATDMEELEKATRPRE